MLKTFKLYLMYPAKIFSRPDTHNSTFSEIRVPNTCIVSREGNTIKYNIDNESRDTGAVCRNSFFWGEEETIPYFSKISLNIVHGITLTLALSRQTDIVSVSPKRKFVSYGTNIPISNTKMIQFCSRKLRVWL